MSLFWVKTFLLSGALLAVSLAAVHGGRAEPFLHPAAPPEKLPLLTIPEIDEFIKNLSRTPLTVAQKIAVASRLALGTPYVQGPLGEGSSEGYDKDPLIDFTRVDCTTFCEQTLALAISRDYPDAFKNLQTIRYHGGTISFFTRNHFILADWLPNNAWLLKDVTQEKGGSLCTVMIKTIDRNTFAASLGYGPVTGFAPPQRMSLHYLPKDHLLTIAPRFKGSEIMVLVTTRDGIFASHLGFIIINQDGSRLFRHASSIAGKVIDEPLQQLSVRLAADRESAGIVLLEVREDFSLPAEHISHTLQ